MTSLSRIILSFQRPQVLGFDSCSPVLMIYFIYAKYSNAASTAPNAAARPTHLILSVPGATLSQAAPAQSRGTIKNTQRFPSLVFGVRTVKYTIGNIIAIAKNKIFMGLMLPFAIISLI